MARSPSHDIVHCACLDSRKPLSALTRVRSAGCDAVARFASDDSLRTALLGVPSERAALAQGVTQLAAATWNEAEDPDITWLIVSSTRPAQCVTV